MSPPFIQIENFPNNKARAHIMCTVRLRGERGPWSFQWMPKNLPGVYWIIGFSFTLAKAYVAIGFARDLCFFVSYFGGCLLYTSTKEVGAKIVCRIYVYMKIIYRVFYSECDKSFVMFRKTHKFGYFFFKCW